MSNEDLSASMVIAPPTEPGWYAYSGGGQVMTFQLDELGRWTVHFDNGDSGKCEWGYIEQALGVWDLVPIPAPRGQD